MANMIFLGDDPEYVQMSNGLTSVVISVVCLAGSSLAITDEDKKMMIWIAQRDQSIRGIGIVGFDVRTMPWNQSIFDSQKKFLIETFDAAMQKTGWDKLDYEPLEEWVIASLAKWKELINRLDVNDIMFKKDSAIWEFDGSIRMFEKCAQHDVYLHAEGCVICNDK